jgi:hypothetical protein
MKTRKLIGLCLTLLGVFLAVNNPTSEDLVRFVLRQTSENADPVEAQELTESGMLFARQVSRINLGVGSLFTVPSRGEEALMLGVGQRFFVVRYAEDGHGMRSAHFLQ